MCFPIILRFAVQCLNISHLVYIYQISHICNPVTINCSRTKSDENGFVLIFHCTIKQH